MLSPARCLRAVTGGGGGANTLDPAKRASTDIVLSGGDLTATRPSGTGKSSVLSIIGHTTGDHWFTITQNNQGGMSVGLSNGTDTPDYLGLTNNSITWLRSQGYVIKNDTAVTASFGPGWNASTVQIVRLKDGFAYWGQDGTYYLGDPGAGTGGIDVSGMGTLYAAIDLGGNLASEMTVDLTNW